VVSNLKKLIPESVQQAWHDWRASMKKAENDMTGNQEVTEHVDMVGWGVEEADARNKKEASMSPFPPHVFLFPLSKLFFNDISRSGNTTCTSLRNPQILHLHSGPSHHFHNTKSREGSVVRVLRSWGWDIGKRTTKEARAIKRATIQASKPAKKR
jgi:hypothetical protein